MKKLGLVALHHLSSPLTASSRLEEEAGAAMVVVVSWGEGFREGKNGSALCGGVGVWMSWSTRGRGGGLWINRI